MRSSTTDTSERLKVARDLHDTVSQEIAALGYACDEAIALSAMGDARESLIAIRARISLVTLMLRDELGALRNSDLPFGTLLDHLCSELRSSHLVSINNGISSELRVEDRLELQLYRVVREILINILSHSGARSITMKEDSTSTELKITVIDDGIVNDAFNSDEKSAYHFGITTIHERIASINGTINYERSGDVNSYEIRIPR